MSSAAIVWIVTIPIVIGIGLFIWFVWENNRKLDSRIRSGDISLLSSSSYKISEVIRAPAGSRVEKATALVAPQGMQGYIRQRLPDGRIALVPVVTAPQPIRLHQSTMHTNQQHRE
jgi:hypothetical protein